MHVLITCKSKGFDQKQSTKVVTSIFRRSRADNYVVSGGIWSKFKLIQAFMHVLITCMYERDPMINSGENVMTSFSPL